MTRDFYFNFPGYLFQRGVEVLRTSYTEGNVSLLKKVEALQSELTAYREDTEFIGERDEEGHLIWEQDQLLELDIEAAEDAIQEFRKAFVLAIYHHWERSIRRYTGVTTTGHGHVVAGAKAEGLSISSDLRLLQVLSNTLKHDTDQWASELFRLWPEVFGSRYPAYRGNDFYSFIRIGDRDIEFLLDIVSASGPDDKTRKRQGTVTLRP